MAGTTMKPSMTTMKPAMGEGKMSGSEVASIEMMPTPVIASIPRPTPKRYETTNDGTGTSHVIVAGTSGEQEG
jgi:hypothetical protein